VTSAFALKAAGALGAVFSPAGPRARLAVFTYHQVLERRDALRLDEPDAQDFRREIETIGRVFHVLPLPEAVQLMAERNLPARAACVTFDDGYANNREVAAPILEAAGLPATFFIACGAVDTGIMWNDLVIETVARCGARTSLAGLRGSDAADLPDVDAASLPAPQLVAELLRRLKYEPLEQRLAAAEGLFRANVGAPPPRLMMTRAQVGELAARGFDLGGHTVSHPILKKLDAQAARAEIAACSEWLERVTGRRPKSFAYPNGRPGVDFGAEHAAMVRDCGYDVAVSTEWKLATSGTDRFAVPRVGPWWRTRRSLPAGLARAYLKSYL
jgi:peptidoglycan/xylan/chitin deacetylase (PgdA/CDA1 family)